VKLDEALTVVAAPDRDVDLLYSALRVVGGHLLVQLDLQPTTALLAVGVEGIALANAASTTFDEPPFVVAPQLTGSYRNPVELRWITGKPPANRPLATFVHKVGGGQRLGAVLDDLCRPADAPPVTVVVAVRIGTLTRGLLAERHPHVTVVSPD
jgi:hypothetical protein